MPPSMRKQAWENLVAEGTNKLCAAGLSLAYADVSDEQKKCLGMTEEAGYTASFNIGEVPCVAASKPAGCGEECIVVMYNSSDVNCALNIVKCAGSLRGLANYYSIKDVAIAKCTLERQKGPYIMESNLDNWHFICSNVHKDELNRLSIQPEGYTLNGKFIF